MNNKDINFVFFGTPDVASETLEILKQSGFLPCLIVTAPDRPAGRKMILTPPPVKTWAIENNIPFIQPENKLTNKEIYDALAILGRSDDDGQKEFSTENSRGEQSIIDFFIVVAYGKILSEEIINMPKYGSINIHYSLLPKYRGASPVESAILNGDNETGIAIQKMVYKMDAGPIIAMEKVAIDPDEHAIELRKKLIKIGGDLLVNTLPDFINGKINLTEQDETKATNCKKIKKEDGILNEADSEELKYNKFRAYSLWPRTFFFKEDKRIIVTEAQIEDSKFVIKKVLPEGKKEISYLDFIKNN
ncbi:MAG: methionyl-tRNA formyltransferase [Candidatus Nomurabacteria bacterium]|nr:methionyl-tRNA formyltransferase [Candidatus Nomurabacteria bacterium]